MQDQATSPIMVEDDDDKSNSVDNSKIHADHAQRLWRRLENTSQQKLP
jgi:hypothetical protein